MIVFDLPLFLVDVGQAESRHEGVVQRARRGEIAHARIHMVETGKLSAFHVRLASRPKRKGPARGPVLRITCRGVRVTSWRLFSCRPRCAWGPCGYARSFWYA